MSNMKKIIAVSAVLIGAVVIAGVISNSAQGAISAECRADLTKCTSTELTEYIAELQLALAQGQAQQTQEAANVPDACKGITFDRNLKKGMSGNDVKCLQAILNQDEDTQVAETGPGSPGNETKYFGAKTKAAVSKYQLANVEGATGSGFVGSLTRAVLNEALKSGVTTTTPTTPTTPTTTTGLAVALVPDTSVDKTLVQGQALANLAGFTFTGSGTVTAITFQRIGVSADSTLSNVYLFDGATRITDAGSVSSTYITFTNPSGLFSVTDTKTITVKSDIYGTGTSGQTVGVQLTSATLSSGTIAGALPMAGSIYTIASATLAGVAVGAPEPSSNITTDPGNGVRVWESTLTVTNRDVKFTRLALRQINSIDKADIKNFKLLVDGEQVGSTVDALDAGNYVTFSGFTKTLSTGTRNVKVIADVIGGSSRYIQMSLRNKADLDVVDSQYNKNIAATGTFAATTGTVQVNTGTMTVVKATDSPSGNITDGASDQVFGKFTFTAYGEAIKVETLLVDFTHVTSGDVAETSTLRNGRILVNGSQVGSTTTLDPAGTGISFTTNFIVNPGTPATVEVRADVYDNDGTNAVSSGDKITATLSAGTANAQKQVSLGTYNVPTANTNANQLIVATGSMTLAKQSTYANRTVVLPQTAYKIGAWNLIGGSTEAINIYTFSVDIDETTGATFNEADLNNLYIKYGSNTSTIKSTAIADNNDWSISYPLQKNEVLPIELYADISATATDGDAFKTDLTVTGRGVSSGATVSEADKDGQTITAGSASISAVWSEPSPVPSVLVDDSGTVTAANYKWTTVNDSYVLTEVVITLAGSTSVQNVILKDGASVLGTLPPNASNAVTFANLNVSIPANTEKVLTVDLQMNTIGYGAGTSDEAITATLTSYKSRPVSSGVVTQSTPGIAATAMYAYKAVPSVTQVALPSGVLSTGTKTLAKFTISSGGTGTIGWRKLLFTVTKNIGGVDTITSPALWDADSNEQITGTGFVTNLGDDQTSGSITFLATSEQQISGAKTYELRAVVSGTPTAGNSINTSIANPSTTHANKARAFARETTSLLYYYDVSDGGTVNAGDVRQTVAPSFTTVDVAAGTDTTGHNAANKIQQAYGITGDITLTLPEWTTDNVINGATFTVSGAGSAGLTCTPYTGTSGSGAVTTQVTTFNAIQSVVCAGTGMSLKIFNLVVTNDTGLNVSNPGLIIVITKGANYAVNSVVAATDSDASLTLSAGAAAASSLLWTDVSAQSHAISTTDWLGDYKVKSLPTPTQNLTL